MTSLQLYLKENLEIALQAYKLDESNILVIQCKVIVLPLQEEFEKFCQYAKHTSELRRYLHLSKLIIEYLKDLIAADWSGNWHFFENLTALTTFTVPGIHQAIIKIKHPKIYEEFIQGQFVVKTSYGNFNFVAADMKLSDAEVSERFNRDYSSN